MKNKFQMLFVVIFLVGAVLEVAGQQVKPAPYFPRPIIDASGTLIDENHPIPSKLVGSVAFSIGSLSVSMEETNAALATQTIEMEWQTDRLADIATRTRDLWNQLKGSTSTDTHITHWQAPEAVTVRTNATEAIHSFDANTFNRGAAIASNTDGIENSLTDIFNRTAEIASKPSSAGTYTDGYLNVTNGTDTFDVSDINVFNRAAEIASNTLGMGNYFTDLFNRLAVIASGTGGTTFDENVFNRAAVIASQTSLVPNILTDLFNRLSIVASDSDFDENNFNRNAVTASNTTGLINALLDLFNRSAVIASFSPAVGSSPFNLSGTPTQGTLIATGGVNTLYVIDPSVLANLRKLQDDVASLTNSLAFLNRWNYNLGGATPTAGVTVENILDCSGTFNILPIQTASAQSYIQAGVNASMAVTAFTGRTRIGIQNNGTDTVVIIVGSSTLPADAFTYRPPGFRLAVNDVWKEEYAASVPVYIYASQSSIACEVVQEVK